MTSSPTSNRSARRPNSARLIVMARYPEPGRVKTRLGRVVGAATACAIYRAFVLDLAERLRTLPYRVTWAYWPPTAPFETLLPRARCRPQRGRDLGARLVHALAEEIASGSGPVLMIGADAPHVPLHSLTEAADALAGTADLVVGPAADGGYYLIGLRALERRLFSRVPWGGPEVCALTLARAGSLGLRTHLLPPTFDVDEAADLDRLRALLTRGEVTLPRTAALLKRRSLDSSQAPGGH